MRSLANILHITLLLTLAAAFGPGVPAGAVAQGYQDAPCALSPLYIVSCGACHTLYSPMLLPAASWEKVIPLSGNHFGQGLGIKVKQLRKVRAFLQENAADRSGFPLALSIATSLPPGETPVRLGEVPFLRAKHAGIAQEVFQRPSVDGFSNCVACHAGASRCNFDASAVSIPR